MTTLYHFASPVKPARRFGTGILATRPVYSVPFTSADLAWLAADDGARELDRRVDEMFEESEAVRRLEAGLCC